MSAAPPNLSVAIADQVAFVKIIGRAHVGSSVYFKTLMSRLKETRFKNFVLDLSECSTMDSTFLGVLVGVVLNPADIHAGAEDFCAHLLNPNQRVTELLDNLGVAHLFQMIHGANPVEGALQSPKEAGASATRQEISRTCLEAHQLLMAVNPENIPKFKDVAQFLAEDLKKLQS